MNWSAFFDYVLPDVPGCGTALALQKIREAAIDFCASTRLYKYTHEPIDIIGDVHTYPITTPPDTRLADVLYASVNESEIEPRGREWLNRHLPGWRIAKGIPRFYLLDADRSEIRLVKKPGESSAGGLALELALKPTKTSQTGPDFLLEDHEPAISAGAKALLFAMKRKPWTDGPLATYYLAEFNRAKGEATAEAARDQTRAPLRSTPVYS